jgi:hypothetical protein
MLGNQNEHRQLHGTAYSNQQLTNNQPPILLQDGCVTPFSFLLKIVKYCWLCAVTSQEQVMGGGVKSDHHWDSQQILYNVSTSKGKYCQDMP